MGRPQNMTSSSTDNTNTHLDNVTTTTTNSSITTTTATSKPYPARTSQISDDVAGVRTDVTCIYFGDKIMVTILRGAQGLGQWITVPLQNDDPTSLDTRLPYLTPPPAPSRPGFDGDDTYDLDGDRFDTGNGDDETIDHHQDHDSNSTTANIRHAVDSDLLSQGLVAPSSRLTPVTLLGARGSERETMGHFYAVHVANAILTKTPEESRSLVLGLGMRRVEMQREVVKRVVELVERVLLA